MRTSSRLGRPSTAAAALLVACSLPAEPPPPPPPPPLPAPVIEVEPPAPPIAADPMLRARGVVLAEGLTLDFDWVQFIGHEGYLAPVVATRDGGFLIVGDRREGERLRPVALRLDSSGDVSWEADLRRGGYAGFEAAAGIETADGAIVAVASYPDPARNPVTRFVALDSRGKPLWDVATRGDGSTRSPYPILGTLDPSGEIALKGWLYDGFPTDGTPRLRWSAVLTSKGRISQEVVEDAPMARDDRSHIVFERDPLWLGR